MKLKTIALAAASLCVAPAFAATGSLSALYGVPAARTVYVSGASALTGSFGAVIAKNCTGGAASMKTLTVGGSTSAGRVFVCTTTAVAGFTPNGPFAVVKRDTNGSFDGVGPVISQTALTTWSDVASCDDVALNCAKDTTTLIKPNAGLSDVDTNVWVGMANTGALSQAVPALGTTIAASGFAGQGFGIMASDALYRAMQVKQVKNGSLPAACSSVTPATLVGVAAADPTFTPGSCQPSISKEEYAAVVKDGNYNYNLPDGTTGINRLVGAVDANPINLCKRVDTSGTQATSNVYFLNNSCANAAPTFGKQAPKAVDITSTTAVVFNTANIVGNYDDFGGAFALFEGSGTGDARNCVINRNNGQNPDKVADTLGKYALGFLSLENVAPTTGWKYLKLNGVSPNAYQDITGWHADATQRLNVINGLYDLSPELQMLWPAATTFSSFLTTLKNDLADPAVVNTTGIFQANGAYTNAAYPAQVHKGTRGGNFCAPMDLAE
jgi:hypothetical protein